MPTVRYTRNCTTGRVLNDLTWIMKKMKKILLMFPLLSCLLLLASCCTREIGNVALITTQPMDYNHAAGRYYVDTTRVVTGKAGAGPRDGWHALHAGVYEAAADAVAQGGARCVGVANAEVEWTGSSFQYGLIGFFAEHQYTVKGNPVYQR